MKKKIDFDPDNLWLSPLRKDRVEWGGPPPRLRKAPRVKFTEPFSARGMKLLYARTDGFAPNDGHSRSRNYHIGLWRRKDGRLFAKFWSRRANMDEWCVELVDFVPQESLRKHDPGQVPAILRYCYNEWLDECFKEPNA